MLFTLWYKRAMVLRIDLPFISLPQLNKMHISNLPSDILMLINSKLNRKAKFNLALTSKSMHEKCRRFKNGDVFDLVLTEQLGSFFHTMIIIVSIHLNIHCIDYNALYTQLNRFYYLASLTVKFSDPITAKIAYSFLSSIPIVFNSSLNLFVEAKHNNVVMDQVVSSHSRKDIVVKRVRSRNTHSRKKRRAPSPIREAIKSVKKLKTLYFEQQEEKNGRTKSEVIPAPLTNIIARRCTN